MKKHKQHLLARKIHRYFGLFIGIQFLFWTVGGLYFSWTNLDDIHGDQFMNHHNEAAFLPAGLFNNLQDSTLQIRHLEIRVIDQTPYLWVNKEKLIDPNTGLEKENITEQEALAVASQHVLPTYKVAKTELITEVDKDHEYREMPLPAWVISYQGDDNLKAYVSARDGNFQRVRHASWRVFDFLWMLHTMDFEARDDINNWVLRIFSLLGIFTVMSGFVLYFYSSKTIRKIKRAA